MKANIPFIAYRVAASLFCKSATVFNPFIYCFLSRGFRQDCLLLTRRLLTCRSPLAHGDDARLHGIDGGHTDESSAAAAAAAAKNSRFELKG